MRLTALENRAGMLLTRYRRQPPRPSRRWTLVGSGSTPDPGSDPTWITDSDLVAAIGTVTTYRFEGTATNWWNTWGDGTSGFTTTIAPYEGAQCGTVTSGSTANGSGRYVPTDSGTADKGDWWLGFVRVRAIDPADAGKHVQLAIDELTADGHLTGASTPVQVPLTEEWQEILVTRQLTSDTVGRVGLRMTNTDATSFTWAVDTAEISKIAAPAVHQSGVLTDDFSDDTDGDLIDHTADSGQAWSTVGSGTGHELVIADGALTNGATGTTTVASYAEVNLGAHVARAGGTVMFSSGTTNGGAATVVVVQGSIIGNGIVPGHAAAHFVTGPAGWALMVIDGEDIPVLGSGSYTLDVDTNYDVELTLRGDRAYVRLPTGDLRVVTDPRIAQFIGSHVVYEISANVPDTDKKAHITQLWADT